MNDVVSVPARDLTASPTPAESVVWGSYAQPRFSARQTSGLPLVWDGDVPASVELTDSRRRHAAGKRLLDVALAGAAIVALAPLLVIVAGAIKATSRGPVFFRQEREGLGGRLFKIFKFRSFASDACDPSGVAQTVANDRRVTPVGRLIRRTSIDELPQLINVLRGDMSLVGPRPHVPGMRAGGMEYRQLVPYYDHRLEVLPGLTGWAQCNGYRGPTENGTLARARVDHDIAYVQNLNVWLDVRIIALTVWNEFFRGSGS